MSESLMWFRSLRRLRRHQEGDVVALLPAAPRVGRCEDPEAHVAELLAASIVWDIGGRFPVPALMDCGCWIEEPAEVPA